MSRTAEELSAVALEMLAACPGLNAAVSPLNAAMCVELAGRLSSEGVPARWAGLGAAESAADSGGCRLAARAFLPAAFARPGIEGTAVFSSEEEARSLAAAWAEEATDGLIGGDRVRPSGEPDKATVFSLAAFKGTWKEPFQFRATLPEPFAGARSVAMMHATRKMGLVRGAGWAAVELPYEGGLRFVGLVREDGMPDPAALLGLLASPMEAVKVRLSLPRFSVGTPDGRLDLMGTSLGREAAGCSLDLAVTAPTELGGAWHDCRVALDEEGTVATAVTEIRYRCASMVMEEPPVPVAFDRPFAFVLAASDVPVFVGRVGEPEALTP